MISIYYMSCFCSDFNDILKMCSKCPTDYSGGISTLTTYLAIMLQTFWYIAKDN